jgi:hypothetical protein
MRTLKLTGSLLAGLLLLTVLVIGLGAFFRAPLLIHFANNFVASNFLVNAPPGSDTAAANSNNIRLSCAKFSVTKNLDLHFSDLCLTHPLFKVRATGLQLQWSLWPAFTLNQIVLDKLELVARADPSSLFIHNKVTKHQPPFSLQQGGIKGSEMLSMVPILPINIREISYQPFNAKSGDNYLAQFSSSKQQLKLAVTDVQHGKLLDLAVNWNKRSDAQISGQLALDLAAADKFLQRHGIKLNQLLLPQRSNAAFTISGQFSSDFTWQNSQLSAQSELNNVSVSGTLININNPKIELPFAVSTQLRWHSLAKNQQLSFDFSSSTENLIALQLNHQASIDYLAQQQVAAALLTLLKDNASNAWGLSPSGTLLLDFNQQQISLSALSMNNQSKQSPLTAQLLGVQLVFAHPQQISADFKLAVKAKVTALKAITSQAVTLVLNGDVSATQQQVMLHFNPDSQLSLTELKPVMADNNRAATSSDKANSALATISLQGGVQLVSAQSPKFDLHLSTALQQVSAPDLLLKPIDVTVETKVNGQLDNINMSGVIQAQQRSLAQFSLKGDSARPTLSLWASDIDLPDLLQSNLLEKFTAELEPELIEGKFNYAIAGQIVNWQQLDKTHLDLSVKADDISGKLGGFWLQDLNWQQRFKIKKGEIVSIDQDKNLTLALVDVGSELTQLSASTRLSLTPDKLTLSVADLSGHAFGGKFNITRLNWPLDTDQDIMLDLSAIDLAKLVELEQQQGITVTGKVSGQLPISYAAAGISISQGKLYNINDGIIQIKDNPMVIQLKQSSTQLKLAFDALQNLYYHQLSSQVSMTNDGQMLLKTVIKGINPDLDNEVNFNFDLDYDLLGLIQSLRITETFEQEINKNSK